MKNWTGCETEATQVISTTTTTTVIVEDNDSSDTSTTTTTTTIQENVNTASLQNKYGYTASVSLLNNNVLSVFKSINNSDSICGTPYYQSLPSGVVNRYSNGKLEISSILNSPFIESEASTYIDLISSSDIKIIVDGNGDENYKFFFISPYTSNIIPVEPSSIEASSGLTEAVFSKQLFRSGYWFYSFAENNSGNIVKSSGLREFAINPSNSQIRDSQSNVELLIFTGNNERIAFGGSVSTTDKIQIIKER